MAIKWRETDHPRDPRTGRFVKKGTPGAVFGRRPPDWAEQLDQQARPRDAAPQVSEQTRALLDRAAQTLPRGGEAWRALLDRTDSKHTRQVDALVVENEENAENAQLILEYHQRASESGATGLGLTGTERGEFIARNLKGHQDRARAAQQLLEYYRRLAADPDLAAKEPGLAGPPLGGAVHVGAKYKDGIGGLKLPPDEFEQHLDTVVAVGESLRRDAQRAFVNDPELARLEREWQAVSDRRDALKQPEVYTEHIAGLTARMRAKDEERKLWGAVKAREQQILLDLLGQIRPYGNEKHTDVTPADNKAADSVQIQDVGVAPAGWRGKFEHAERMFPDDWVRRSAARSILVVSSPRAFHLERNGGTILAFDDSGSGWSSYMGGFPDLGTEIATHEMGHQMETTVPGLKELEYTLVRRRSGPAKLPRKIRELVGNSIYTEAEMTYEDEWRNPYTGKTYEMRAPGVYEDDDPAARAWEVFQVGLQDTFGRQQQHGGDELQAFTLGVLATLDRQVV